MFAFSLLKSPVDGQWMAIYGEPKRGMENL